MRRLIVLALLVTGGAASPASADLIWDWSYNVTVDSGNTFIPASGTFTTSGTTPTANTAYTILSITGSRGSDPITGLDSSYDGPDNMFEWNGTPSSPILVDFGGFSYDTQSGNMFNVSQLSGGFAPAADEFNTTGMNNTFGTSSLSPQVASPEPSSLILAGLGALGGVGTWWRRRRKAGPTSPVADA
ncbi:MAG TPA: PEP-CTERM sorting domain-containing protein, partial [Gemmataceae bacterium]|nr:PEP-CTERM sorting domain-containing protein [Gemmataceae bacterium]